MCIQPGIGLRCASLPPKVEKDTAWYIIQPHGLSSHGAQSNQDASEMPSIHASFPDDAASPRSVLMGHGRIISVCYECYPDRINMHCAGMLLLHLRSH